MISILSHARIDFAPSIKEWLSIVHSTDNGDTPKVGLLYLRASSPCYFMNADKLSFLDFHPMPFQSLSLVPDIFYGGLSLRVIANVAYIARNHGA